MGYVGAAVGPFLVQGEGEHWWLDAVDTLARPEHALTEESTGASFVGLRLRIALGGRLEPEPPSADGWAVEVRLLAHDPERGHAPSSGPLLMLSLPVGTGVRVDASLREGDVVDARSRSGARDLERLGHGTAARPSAGCTGPWSAPPWSWVTG